ncbi:TetR/AcrR family transcriptional regulator [Parasphingorhabdus sp.]|uniref:TetR/AcrR family transcriptional regulator n=1 Tax=Parasphingorhabdus sp. TaxID=2709688 RepID=UPI003BAF66EF
MKFQPDFTTDPPVSDDFISSPSVIKILSGALDAIAGRGVTRLSMSDIIEASGVSRGTMYRYFSNKEDVLAAVAEYVCTGFEEGIQDAAQDVDDPIECFRQVMLFYSQYTNEHSPDRVFEVEPRFHLAFFRSRFDRYKIAVSSALEPVFKFVEIKLGKPVNAEAFVEALVRLQLSTLLVPADENWTKLWNGSADNLEKWVLDFAHQTA